MKSKHARLTAAFIASLLVIAPVSAQVGKGLSGPHYNLNIIGVPKDKTADMKNSSGHSIFVPLNANGEVSRKVKIYYKRNVDDPDAFVVEDRNATDDNEATILVPFEFCPEELAGCTDLLSYDVYAVGLGKPNGSAMADAAYCLYDDEDETQCGDTVMLGSFTIQRKRGKPKREPITEFFRVTGCLDTNETGMCDGGDVQFSDVWLFNVPELWGAYWDYDNDGLKLLQMRFYATTSGCIGTVGGEPDCS